MRANDIQIGGDHYKKFGKDGEQHWDRIIRLFPDSFEVYFVAAITKYVERYRHKNGIEDLKKARHYLDKLIEAETARAEKRPVELPDSTVDNPHANWVNHNDVP